MKTLLLTLFSVSLCTAAGLNNALYRVWPVDYLHKVTRTASPVDTLSGLAMKASVNEWETGTFVVRAKSAITALNVTGADFVNSSTGRIIPGDSVALRRIEYVWEDAARTQQIPMRLRPAAPLSLAANENMEYWLTLCASDQRDTGLFLGKAVINGDNTVCTLSVSFYVYPFRLLDFTDFACGVYASGPRTISPAMARDMKAHGVDAVSFFFSKESTRADYYRNDTTLLILNQAGHLKVEMHGVDSLVKFMKAAGMRGPVIPFLGNDSKSHIERDICDAFPQFHLDTTYNASGKTKVMGPLNDPVFDTLLISAVRQLKEGIESHGLEMILTIYDEPTERLMTELADRYALIRAAFPSLRIYGVAMDQLSWAQQIAPYTDIIATNGSYLAMSQYTNAQNKGLLYYGVIASRYEAGYCRGNYGLKFWKYSPDFVFLWAYNYWNGDPYVNYDGASPEATYAIVFPPPNHPDSLPVGSPAWEGVREARDDWAYVKTFTEMLKTAAGPTAVAKASEFNALKNKVTDTQFNSEGARYVVLDSIRQVVAGWIMALIREEPGKFGNIGVAAERGPAEAASLSLYASPNPFRSMIKISVRNLGDMKASVSIYDVNGKRVCVLNSDLTWDAAGKPAGVYFVRLKTDRGRAVNRKIVLMR